MENLKLIKLSWEYEKQLVEMIDEWKLDQDTNNTDRSPWAIFKNDPHDFQHYLDELDIVEPHGLMVPESVYFLLDEDRDRLLGAITVRHYLSEYLLREGGHVGDGIRPSERGKGYATKMIALILPECRKLGLDKILMICNKDNIASAKAIRKNGGVLENEITNDEGEVLQRYWITL